MGTFTHCEERIWDGLRGYKEGGCVEGEMCLKLIKKKVNKGSGDLRVRYHPAKCRNCGKQLKTSLEPGMVRHTYNASTRKTEAGGSLLRSSLST